MAGRSVHPTTPLYLKVYILCNSYTCTCTMVYPLYVEIIHEPYQIDRGGFQKSVTLRVELQNMNTLMKPLLLISRNIELSEFSKFLSHIYLIFLRK